MEFSKEQKREAFKKLPGDTRSAITSVETGEAIDQIGKRYKMHLDQVGELESEINLVMLGFKQANNLADNLRKKLQLSEEQVLEIAKEVDSQIFLKIRESLKKLHTQQEQKSNTPKQVQNEIETSTNKKEVISALQKNVVDSAPATERETNKNNVPANLPTGDISSLKLGNAISIPKEEQKASTETQPMPKADEREYSADPYREPIDNLKS